MRVMRMVRVVRMVAVWGVAMRSVGVVRPDRGSLPHHGSDQHAQSNEA